ncbi:MAG: hypothetical protein ACREHG_07565 [Candidatus Saccharimonadales bacterium]
MTFSIQKSAALQASELSGLPSALTSALISEEGTINEKGVNNPFDVTKVWANLTGFGGYVVGILAGNQAGVADFSNMSMAIQAWAKGLESLSNYTQYRADVAKGESISQILQDLANAGYAGANPMNWLANVKQLYEKNSGNNPDTTNVSGQTTTTTTTPTTTTTTPTPPTTPGMPSKATTLSFGQGILFWIISFFIGLMGLGFIGLGLYLLVQDRSPGTIKLAETLAEAGA